MNGSIENQRTGSSTTTNDTMKGGGTVSRRLSNIPLYNNHNTTNGIPPTTTTTVENDHNPNSITTTSQNNNNNNPPPNNSPSSINSTPHDGHTFRRRRLTYTAHTPLPSSSPQKPPAASTADDAPPAPPAGFMNMAQAAALAAADFIDDNDSEDEVEVPIRMPPLSIDDKTKTTTAAAAAAFGKAHRRVSDIAKRQPSSGSSLAEAAAAEYVDDDDDEEAWSNNKRPAPRGSASPPPRPQRPRLSQQDSPPPPSSSHFESRTKRATEMTLVQKPDEEFVVLPRQKAADIGILDDATADNKNRRGGSGGTSSSHGGGGGKQRRLSQQQEDDLLPFPRELVGTYSCHGVEPLYDDGVGEEEEDEEESGGSGGEGKGCSTVAKINQDRGSVAFPYGNHPKTALFAAYDGHGVGGELVAQFAMSEIQRRLHKHPLFNKDVDAAFRFTFVDVDNSLRNQAAIEPLYSGSTACAVLMRDNILTISNVGDSRAVLARRRKGSDKFIPINLSIDQNPDSPGEQDRIERCGGYVTPPPEVGLSARVWLDPDYTQIGLAMSRSIGDHAVKRIGVIAEPVVTTHELTDDDEFMIIATDGVWEFIDSEEAVNIVGQYFAYGDGASRACQGLIEVAASKWHEYEGDYRDDITALVIKIDDVRKWW